MMQELLTIILPKTFLYTNVKVCNDKIAALAKNVFTRFSLYETKKYMEKNMKYTPLLGFSLILTGAGIFGTMSSKFISSDKQKIIDQIVDTGISAQKMDSLQKSIGKAPILRYVFSPGEEAARTLSWQKALDAIKLEGAVKKSYLEGQQAVRDSIAVAKNTAKHSL